MHLFGKEIRTFSSCTTNRPPQKAEASPLGYRLPSRKYVIPVPLARLEPLKIHLMGCLWGAVPSVDTFLKCLNQVMGFFSYLHGFLLIGLKPTHSFVVVRMTLFLYFWFRFDSRLIHSSMSLARADLPIRNGSPYSLVRIWSSTLASTATTRPYYSSEIAIHSHLLPIPRNTNTDFLFQSKRANLGKIARLAEREPPTGKGSETHHRARSSDFEGLSPIGP